MDYVLYLLHLLYSRHHVGEEILQMYEDFIPLGAIQNMYSSLQRLCKD